MLMFIKLYVVGFCSFSIVRMRSKNLSKHKFYSCISLNEILIDANLDPGGIEHSNLTPQREDDN